MSSAMLTSAAVLTDADFERISEAVYAHCGINLHDGKKELVQARVVKRLHATGSASVKAYLDKALADKAGNEFKELVDALSTNLTSFFRENAHFDFLVQTLLPQVAAKRKREGKLRLRAWSAGCSTGEEPYSLAMTLAEALPAADGWDVKLLATDISRRVLRAAMAGRYPKDRMASVPQGMRAKYVLPCGEPGMVDISPSVRQMIQFNYLNLMEPWPFSGPLDFVFCRNVMIYFDKPTQQKLVNRFYDVLGPGGVLFTGHSESLTGVNHKFAYVQPTVYRKT